MAQSKNEYWTPVRMNALVLHMSTQTLINLNKLNNAALTRKLAIERYDYFWGEVSKEENGINESLELYTRNIS